MNLDNTFQQPFKQDQEYFGEGQSEGNSGMRTFEYATETKNMETVEGQLQEEDTRYTFELQTSSEQVLDLPCGCGGHIMRLWKDEDSISVAFYVYAPSSFTARIKKAWKLLFKGERVLLDDIVIDQTGIDKLKEFLK